MKLTRRRRTWYRRRLRAQRIMVAVFFGTVIAAACWQNAARFLPLPTLHTSQMLPDSFSRRVNVHRNLALRAMAASARPAKVLARIPDVYPYSIIPGGVKNLDDLRNAAAHDFVVKSHYANFDYGRAHLVRVTQPREVYLSYRIRNTVFWTRRRARLRVGELLLTDGKITARAHCGNQISDTAKPEVSNEEPAEDILNGPVLTAMESPYLPIRPVLSPSDLPFGQPNPPLLFGGGLIFPTVPYGAPISGSCPAGEVLTDGHCHVKHRSPIVPEPPTMLLIVSGLALIAWRFQRTARPIA
jgi:hypothetical protein